MAAEDILQSKIQELAYYYLENDTQVAFQGTEKEIKALQEKIIKTIDEIKNFDFKTFLESHKRCEYCKGIL